MVRAFLPKAVLLLVLILLLGVPATQAAEPGSRHSPAHNGSGSAAWDVFTQVWTYLTRAWAANGCIIDPDGRCLPTSSATAEADNGCGIDPDGRCLPLASATAEADNGCRLDPSGRCGG